MVVFLRKRSLKPCATRISPSISLPIEKMVCISARPKPTTRRRAVPIGVDLGPNLSFTGSLATILWLTALRGEGQTVSVSTFLKLGIVVMPPARLLAIGAAFLFG